MMEKRNLGIIIRVRDLNMCRIFYRDQLGLGEPVLDSREIVEFHLPDGNSVVLEHVDGEYLEHKSSAISFFLKLPGFTDRMEMLMSNEMTEAALLTIDGVGSFLRIFDPEGNSIYLAEAE